MLICPFIMKMSHRLLLHVIFYFKIDKITGKSRFQGKETLVSVVAGYRNTMHISKVQYKYVTNMHTSAGGWDTVQFVVMRSMMSQSLIVSVRTVICNFGVKITF